MLTPNKNKHGPRIQLASGRKELADMKDSNLEEVDLARVMIISEGQTKHVNCRREGQLHVIEGKRIAVWKVVSS